MSCNEKLYDALWCVQPHAPDSCYDIWDEKMLNGFFLQERHEEDGKKLLS